MQKLAKLYRNNAKLTNLILALLAPSLIIIAVLWIPFGFYATGLIEEWGLLGLYTTYGPIFFEHIDGPLALHALRPLMVFPLSLAYAIDPNSFTYWHIFTILSLVIKGAAASYLLWIATGSRFWAALMGCIILLYPADTMQLPLRPLQINWAVALLLLGSSFFIIAYQSKRSLFSYVISLFAAFLLLTAICMYEITAGLIFLPFMILFVRYGLNATLRACYAKPLISIFWLMSLLIYIIYCAIISHKITSYQSQLLIENPIKTFIRYLPNLFSIGLLRSLLGGWFDALGMTLNEFNLYGYFYLLSVTSSLGGLLLLMIKKDNQDLLLRKENNALVLGWRLSLIGITLICLGYAPFLLVPSHLYISQRTFLFTAPGAAIVCIAFLMLFFYKQKWLAFLLALFIIFIGLGMQLFQQYHYAKLSNTQQVILKNIVENFDGNLQGKTLLLLDEGNQLDHTWMLIKENLVAALTYFYQKPIPLVQICYLPTHEWRSKDALSRSGRCIDNIDSWIFRSATAIPVSGPQFPSPIPIPDLIIPKNKVIALTIKPDGSIEKKPILENYRKTLQTSSSLTAKRYRNILANEPRYKHFISLWANHPEQYRWHFGDWWSLEIPTRGSGWREAEWEVNYFKHHASAWKIEENATLLFDLFPVQKPYILRGKFAVILEKISLTQIKVSINHKPIAIHWKKAGKFFADIPAGILVNGVNTIEFNSPIDAQYYGLSLKLSSFEVLPIK